MTVFSCGQVFFGSIKTLNPEKIINRKTTAIKLLRNLRVVLHCVTPQIHTQSCKIYMCIRVVFFDTLSVHCFLPSFYLSLFLRHTLYMFSRKRHIRTIRQFSLNENYSDVDGVRTNKTPDLTSIRRVLLRREFSKDSKDSVVTFPTVYRNRF